jgi:hypothetical protein
MSVFIDFLLFFNITSTKSSIDVSVVNLSYSLLKVITTLPDHARFCIFSQLNCTELLRLSTCCRLLRSTIKNGNLLWKRLYNQEFLSKAYYNKELEFLL